MRALLPIALALAGRRSAAPAVGRRTTPRAAATCPSSQRLPGCTIHECRTRDYDEAELQSGPVDGSGDFPKALVDGELAVVTYACPASLSLADIARQAQAALRRAGLLVRLRGRHVPQRPARLHRPPRRRPGSSS